MASNIQAQSFSDTSEIQFKIPKDDKPYTKSGVISPLYLKPPSNINEEIVYDPDVNGYVFSKKVGSINYSRPMIMTIDEYRLYQAQKAQRDYWREKSANADGSDQPGFVQSFNIGGETFDKVFGTNSINIVPQGSAEVILGYKISNSDNPNVSEEFKRTGSLIFDSKIQMNVNGTIGDKMELGINYNTDATFEFENKTKLEYTGKEDEIIKKIEAGNVSLPLSGTLINGSQSLFGIKTELQFGNLTVTNVFSHQKGESQVINIEGGAQLTDFEIEVDDYEESKHYFLSHYFRDSYAENYRKLQESYPVNIQIENIEVWVTSKQGYTGDNKNIIAFTDLAEDKSNMQYKGDEIDFYYDDGSPPSNEVNDLYNQLINSAIGDSTELEISEPDDIKEFMEEKFSFLNNNTSSDYNILNKAKKLSANEFNVNRQLGYISLNFKMQPDEILAVAFEYSYKGELLKVGELVGNASGSNSQVIIVKLLKPQNPSPKLKTWDLMMKNVYSLGAYSVNSEEFIFNIYYRSDKTGSPATSINEGSIAGQKLLSVTGLDKVNFQGTPVRNGDGMFDFIEGVTITSRNGRVFFPTIEPFGKDLRRKIVENDPVSPELHNIADKYVFQELYDSTKTNAKQIAEKNKFLFKGTYKSSVGSEIQLNAMNIPQGSVKITSGGRLLEEGPDYSVDYTLGRVKILDDGLLESGAPLKISLESNSLFNFQTKTFMGANLNYRINDNFNIGASYIHLTEKPLTKKVNIGDEPVSNTIWGLNTSYRTESPWLTNAVDKYIPFVETKEKSIIDINAEFAQLIPGQPKIIGKNGIAYIDDFESSETSLDIRNALHWRIASVPQGLQNEFPGGYEGTDTISSGFNRAKLSWYHISEDFYNDNKEIIAYNSTLREYDHRWRKVYSKEILPGADESGEIIQSIKTLDLTFYPNERGPYNYVTEDAGPFKGLNSDGTLKNPEQRWGGMMRAISTNDFEEANIEYIEFWLMDPYAEEDEGSRLETNPELIFHLGSISEDVLRDGKMFMEQVLPPNGDYSDVDTVSTNWGRVVQEDAYVDEFDANKENRGNQDVGLDGLTNEEEAERFAWYEEKGGTVLNGDYAGDDFTYYDSDEFSSSDDILTRYKNFNGVDKNSLTTLQTNTQFIQVNYITPDQEDLDGDNNLNTNEAYFKYSIRLKPEDFDEENPNPYLVDVQKVGSDISKASTTVNWYQFRIPISDGVGINGIEDFSSIKFMRMIVKGFEQPVTLRFGTLQLVRSEWRKYKYNFRTGTGGLIQPVEQTNFDLASVNIEENRSKYATPPGIDRTIDPYNPQLQQDNEQSMVFRVEDLEDGDARGAFKNMSLDMRNYKHLKMFVHAEEIAGTDLNDYDLNVFIRLGSDYTDNYYEYEVPLKLTTVNFDKSPITSDNPSDDIRDSIWKPENNINILLDEFTNLKLERNQSEQSDTILVDRTRSYSAYIDHDGNNSTPKRRITIKGNPNLANVRTLMIGVRNPGDSREWRNDGLPKTGEIWVNELRLTDFNNEGGWAANTRVQTKLADFATVSASSSMSTPGFGSVDQKVNERAKEQAVQFDVTSNVELGKFFPEKAKVSIPMHVSYSKNTITPEYFPFDPDIEYNEAVQNYKDKEHAVDISQDITERKSLNFTNVKVNQRFKKAGVVSPANFSLSTGFSRSEHSNINYDDQTTIKYKLALNYDYSIRTKPFTPFAKSKALRSKHLRILRDFNITFLPSRVSFKTNFDRTYSHLRFRDLEQELIRLNEGLGPLPDSLKAEPSASKEFTWIRDYSFNWNITRSLKVDYSATNRSLIDEPEGAYDYFVDHNARVIGENNDTSYYDWVDYVKKSIGSFGINQDFQQNVNASYTLPINKIPAFNWVNINSRYSAKYNWKYGIHEDYGNNISNNATLQINTTLNLKNLYNKVGYFKKLDSKSRGRNQEKETKIVTYVEDGTYIRSNVPKRITHRLKTEEITIKVYDRDNKEISCNLEIVDENRIRVISDADITSATVVVEGEVEKRDNPLVFVTENSLRMMLGVKRISISYKNSGGSNLQGYIPQTKFVGLDNNKNWAPGGYYLLGLHMVDPGKDVEAMTEATMTDLLDNSNRWFTTEREVYNNYSFSNNQTFNVKVDYEPFNWINIDLNIEHSYTENFSGMYYYDGASYIWDWDDEGEGLTTTLGGNYSMSIISIGSAFEKSKGDDIKFSQAFEELLSYRSVVSNKLSQPVYDGDLNMDNFYSEAVQYEFESDTIVTAAPGFQKGYGPTHQQVLISSFLAAYSAYDIDNVPTTTLPRIENGYLPLPNWQIRFTGLNKIDFIKDNFKSVNLSHGYRSRYSISSFSSNSNYREGSIYVDQYYNYAEPYTISGVSISEQFSPLINVNVTFKNDFTTKFEIKNTRNLALSFTNVSVTETLDDSYIVGFGYKFKQVPLLINGKNYESDLDLKADFNFRNNRTILRAMDIDPDDDNGAVTAGNKTLTVSLSADYAFSESVNARAHVDINNNNPHIGGIPIRTTEFGISIKFMLAQ